MWHTTTILWAELYFYSLSLHKDTNPKEIYSIVQKDTKQNQNEQMETSRVTHEGSKQFLHVSLQ